jgi:hypothetical protein
MNFGDAVTGGAGLGGLGLDIFGGLAASSAASQVSQYSQNIAQLQIQENGVRRQAMELSTRRQETENTRNVQKAQAMALAVGTNQGAAYGQSSGYRAGEAGAASQGGVNTLGLSQNQQFGEQMFNLNDQISANQIYMAREQGYQSSMSGIAGIGSALLGSAGTLGKLAMFA